MTSRYYVAVATWIVLVGAIVCIAVFFHGRTFDALGHRFADARELSEEVAIEYTKKALQAERKSSILSPIKFSNDECVIEKVFARNSENPNAGYVLWGIPPRVNYLVRIEKSGEAIRCVVHRTK